MFIGFTQIDHTALNTSLTSARKVKWLRERMIGSSTETLLMNRIKEFILHDEPIDVEKLRKCLHRQVWSLSAISVVESCFISISQIVRRTDERGFKFSPMPRSDYKRV